MILCCGEALIDMLPRETAEGEGCFAPHSGGAVFNTSIALGRLDHKVGLLTGVSTDMFGQQLQRDLGKSNVDTSRLILSDRNCTVAFVKLTNGQARYAFYDENTAGRMITPQDVPALDKEVTTLFFGGISLAVEPCADTYAHILETEGKDRVVMIDPNIRPSFIKDEERYRARLNKMIAGCDIVKISDEDLAWIMDAEDMQDSHIDDLLQAGPKLVLVTRGGEGAMAALADGTRVNVPAKTAKVVDTVGAGDTFNAGALAALADQGQLSKSGVANLSPEKAKEVLSFAATVAAVTVSRAGANPPWAHELS